MLSNLLSLVIIVCIHRIKDTKRWFRESPTEQGDSNPCFPTATSVPQGEVLILWLLHRVEEKKNLSTIPCFVADSLPIPKNSLFSLPRFFNSKIDWVI